MAIDLHGFRSWSGYQGYYFGRYWSAAMISTATIGMAVGFLVGLTVRAIFLH
jgi:hypothetical protein